MIQLNNLVCWYKIAHITTRLLLLCEIEKITTDALMSLLFSNFGIVFCCKPIFMYHCIGACHPDTVNSTEVVDDIQQSHFIPKTLVSTLLPTIVV
jgi:hypothetical protein